VSHESDDGEDDETGKEACARVDAAHENRLSVKKKMKIQNVVHLLKAMDTKTKPR
jgi:hypothetical protein